MTLFEYFVFLSLSLPLSSIFHYVKKHVEIKGNVGLQEFFRCLKAFVASNNLLTFRNHTKNSINQLKFIFFRNSMQFFLLKNGFFLLLLETLEVISWKVEFIGNFFSFGSMQKDDDDGVDGGSGSMHLYRFLRLIIQSPRILCYSLRCFVRES